jgi:hypothetical protein
LEGKTGHGLVGIWGFSTFLDWVNQCGVRDDIMTVIADMYDEVERVLSEDGIG